MGETSQVATLGSAILFLLYAVTMLFCLFRTIRLHKFSPEWKPSKGFYFSVFFQSLLRSVCFLVLLLEGSTQLSDTSVFLLLSIPDSVFIVSYILLLWQVLLVFMSSHTTTHASFAIFSRLFKMNQHNKLSSYVAFCLTVWIGTQTCLYFLVGNHIIHFKNISREVGICNFGLASSTVAGLIALQIRYSGVPLRTAAWKAKLNRINLVTGFWTAARIFQGVIDILDENHSTSLSYQISNSQQNSLGTSTAAFLFSVLIISEIVCILMVLDYAFMGIFVFSEEDNRPKSQKEMMRMSFDSSHSLFLAPLQLRLNMKDVCVLSQISPRKQGLGKIFRATYNERRIFLRKIIFSRLSTYVLEEFSYELDSYSNDNYNILPLVGVIIDLPTISILTPFIEPGSLFKILHIDQASISMQTKLKYVQQIASAFAHIHSSDKVHGHLTSENVLVNEHDHVYISDLGMNKIKKYSGIVSGYTNKSVWSSPELLKDKRLTPSKPEMSDDVYSFGILFWEILAQEIPFCEFGKEEFFQKVVVEGYRLEFPEGTPKKICELISMCWHPQPSLRPIFDDILVKLKLI